MITFTISSPSDSDQRIDKFIKKILPNAPLGGIYKWLRVGKIKVNRKKVEQTYRVEIDDIIDIHLHEDEINGFQEKIITQTKNEKREVSLEILYEDEDILIVNKTAGINVHPGDHKTKEISLIEQVQDILGNKYNSLSFKPSLVHRIDRDTSGAIMIAKTKKMLDSLLFLLQNGKIEKTYHAIVVGRPDKTRDTIRKKLLRIENAKNEAKVRVDEQGQEAITHYRILKEKIKEKYSLIEAQIETGRTHQIRVHFASIGSPILGDQSYGSKSENSFAGRNFDIKRQLLHAYSLKFDHPKTHKNIDIVAPYKEDMKKILL